MKKIKQQIINLRSTMPKHVQWLVMAAAFIVVLILLTLLVGGGKKDKDKIDIDNDAAINLIIDPESIDWTGTKIGETRRAEIKIRATAPVKIAAVRYHKELNGLTIPGSNCKNVVINPKLACTITVEYVPTQPTDLTAIPLFVDWHGENEPEAMKKKSEIIMSLSAIVPEIPASVANPEQGPAKKPDPEPIKTEIKQEINAIAPADPFVLDDQNTLFEEPNYAAPSIDEIEPVTEFVEPAPVAAPIAKEKPRVNAKPTVPEYTPVLETCSDFAFPGYNSGGTQIGWIKPERGAYYFHPFSDRNCDTPTGVYNPDNGIITDIKDASKKIGTDAEHIGYTTIASGVMPQLSNPVVPTVKEPIWSNTTMSKNGAGWVKQDTSDVEFKSSGDTVTNTIAYDRTFILRQYKPIPATIVSDVRADAVLDRDNNIQFPVRATVDRNVYSDNGRTVIIPTGTLLMGYVTGNVPGPYKSIGRMNIRWYQFILPNGMEFNFDGNDPYSADAQGRVGVPGRGSTDYLEQFVMPMLTAIVPAAVNMIAPVADKFVNQIDLDNNTVVQSGTMRSSELAKNEIITAWNQVAQKLMVDMMDNNVPPFTIPAGTRITVYSPVDLQVTCGARGSSNKKCAIAEYSTKTRQKWSHQANPANDGSWVGQARSFDLNKYCIQNNKGVWEVDSSKAQDITQNSGYSYSTVVGYCQSLNYQAINNVRQDAIYQNQQETFKQNEYGVGTIQGVGSTGSQATSLLGNQKYNEEILGLKYNEDGSIQNPYQAPATEDVPAAITCEDGNPPDANGCCAGETYTDLGTDGGFACCPDVGGDCFPPIL